LISGEDTMEEPKISTRPHINGGWGNPHENRYRV
jgi:hypothetical protein